MLDYILNNPATWYLGVDFLTYGVYACFLVYFINTMHNTCVPRGGLGDFIYFVFGMILTIIMSMTSWLGIIVFIVKKIQWAAEEKEKLNK